MSAAERSARASARADGAPARSAGRLSLGPASRPSPRSRPTPSRRPTRSPMRSSATIRSSCAMNSATCCSRWCSTRAWPRSAAGSISPPSPGASTTSCVRRHPHVFAGAALAAEDLVRVWEEQKAAGARRRGRRCCRGGTRRRPAGAAGTDARREARQARRARRASTGRRPPTCAPRCSRNSHEVDAALAVGTAGEPRHARRSPRNSGTCCSRS